MIYIRTDANEIIATGHVMRCATIAYKLEELGEKVIFLVSDDTSARLVREMGFACEVLDSDWENPQNEEEFVKMKMLLQEACDREGELPKLLVDSYMIKGCYTKKLIEYAYIVVIDDLFEEKFSANIIINYNIHYGKFDYDKRYNKTSTKMLLGCKYMPLRQQFSDISVERKLHAGKIRVMLICGGGDRYNALSAILEKFVGSHANNELEFFVVAGAYNNNKNILKEYEKTNANIHILENVSNMAQLMSECDIAVSAAGTVLYECCAMKLPTIFFCVADNQQANEQSFTADGLMIYAGDIRKNREACINNIKDNVNILKNDLAMRNHMIKQMELLVDGKGAERIAYEIMQH